MWLPGPLYESLPYCYLLGGVLFISGTYYIGLSAPGATIYLACGIVSIIAGAVVLIRRQVYRAAAEQLDHADFA